MTPASLSCGRLHPVRRRSRVYVHAHAAAEQSLGARSLDVLTEQVAARLQALGYASFASSSRANCGAGLPPACELFVKRSPVPNRQGERDVNSNHIPVSGGDRHAVAGSPSNAGRWPKQLNLKAAIGSLATSLARAWANTFGGASFIASVQRRVLIKGVNIDQTIVIAQQELERGG